MVKITWNVFRKILLLAFVNGGVLNLASAQFSADEKLNIISDKGVAVLKLGHPKTIHCLGHEPGMKWMDPSGKVVGPRNPRRHVHVEEAPGQLVLMFEDPMMADNGTWSCSAGNMERNIHIFVVEEVQFENPRSVETPLEGLDQTLTCAARGAPAPRLSWYRNALPITASSNPNKYEVNGGKLLVRRTTRQDTGEYECRALQNSTVWNNTASSIIRLLVKHGPVMKFAGVQDIYVLYDHMRTLRCPATAFPKPSYRWSHLRPRVEKFIPSYGRDIFIAKNGSYSELTVRVNGVDDLGDYSCYARNAHGQNKTVFRLIKANKPNPPVKAAYKSSTNDSLVFELECGNCTWLASRKKMTVGRGGTVPEVGYRFELMKQNKAKMYADLTPVYWEDEDRERVLTVDVQKEATDQNVTAVRGLPYNTTYMVRVATLNVAGPSEFVELNKQYTTAAAATLTPPILLFLCSVLARGFESFRC